jgi:uncharacterized membrane-anchored protein
MRKLTLLPLCLFIAITCFADKGGKKKVINLGNGSAKDSAAIMQAYLEQYSDSVTTAMKYQTGTVALPSCNAVLNITPGFKFLNAEQSQYVLNKVWGNPPRTDVLGMIFPEASDPFTDSSYVFMVSFDDMGYVKDDDAKEIDYNKMVVDAHEAEPKINAERTAGGFSTIHMVGWAEQPYYDDKQKVLHWAKELKFGDADANTLNYEVRVLGRKGVLSLEAIAGVHELPLVNKDINKVLAMASFTQGNTYADHTSNDKIAAYTVGGLVAGTILTKVGFWAIIVKFAKLIIVGIVGAFYAVRKWLTGKGRKKDELAPMPVQDDETTTV